METPKKTLKKTTASKKPLAGKSADKPAPKPKSRFDDDDDDDDLGGGMDDFGGFEHFDGLADDDDF